jgi:hypothetical protein
LARFSTGPQQRYGVNREKRWSEWCKRGRSSRRREAEGRTHR